MYMLRLFVRVHSLKAFIVYVVHKSLQFYFLYFRGHIFAESSKLSGTSAGRLKIIESVF